MKNVHEWQKQTRHLIKEGIGLKSLRLREGLLEFFFQKKRVVVSTYLTTSLNCLLENMAGEKGIKVTYNTNTRGPEPKKATLSLTWALTAISLTLLLDLHVSSQF